MWAFVDSSWYFYNLFYLVIILKLYPTDDSRIFFIQVLNYTNKNEFSISTKVIDSFCWFRPFRPIIIIMIFATLISSYLVFNSLELYFLNLRLIAELVHIPEFHLLFLIISWSAVHITKSWIQGFQRIKATMYTYSLQLTFTFPIH